MQDKKIKTNDGSRVTETSRTRNTPYTCALGPVQLSNLAWLSKKFTSDHPAYTPKWTPLEGQILF